MMSPDCARCAVLQDENDILLERVRQLKEEILGSEWAAPLEYRLTPPEERILAALVARERCTTNFLMLALYDGMDEAGQKIIGVFIFKIRKKLKPFGIRIDTLWGRGYMLDPESRKCLRGTADKAEKSDAA